MYQRAIIVGTGRLAFTCAQKVRSAGMTVSVIENKTAHRLSNLYALCQKDGIAFCTANKAETMAFLENSTVPLIVFSVVNKYIFPPIIIKNPNIRIVNFHNSLLPRHAGRNAEAWAIFTRDKAAGITWHYVDISVDGGDILCQKAMDLPGDITSLKLLKEQHNMAASAFDEILPDVLTGRNGIRQPTPDWADLHYARDIPGNGELDIRWDKNTIYAFLRAMDYGSLYVLGHPSIVLDGVRYTWSGYHLTDCVRRAHDNNHAALENGTIVIMCQTVDIRLWNIRKIEPVCIKTCAP